MKLSEGEFHFFQVLKRISLPEEGEFFLLRHQSGRRLMLPIKYYINYNITQGETIQCKVDKVSCTGKVYLEPIHPIYKEGELYTFDNHGIEVNEDSKTRILHAKDVYGNIIPVLCSCNTYCSPGNKVTLKVLAIRKGIPQLACKQVQSDKDYKELIGTNIEFKVVRLEKKENKDDFYYLENLEGYKAKLKKKYYEHYKININDIISCEVYDYTHLGELKVEPKNPYYTVGKRYVFDIDSIDFEEIELPENVTVTLKDCYGNKCGLEVDYATATILKKNTRLLCRVIGFRKGKPKLSTI
jgi:hypothetical protein